MLSLLIQKVISFTSPPVSRNQPLYHRQCILRLIHRHQMSRSQNLQKCQIRIRLIESCFLSIHSPRLILCLIPFLLMLPFQSFHPIISSNPIHCSISTNHQIHSCLQFRSRVPMVFNQDIYHITYQYSPTLHDTPKPVSLRPIKWEYPLQSPSSNLQQIPIPIPPHDYIHPIYLSLLPIP